MATPATGRPSWSTTWQRSGTTGDGPSCAGIAASSIAVAAIDLARCDTVESTATDRESTAGQSPRVVVLLPTAAPPPLLRAAVDLLHLLQQLDRVGQRPLEAVAAHDRAERAAGGDALDLRQHLLGALGLAAGEDDDAAAAERTLHHVLHAVGQRGDRDLLRLVHLLRRLLLDVFGRRLDLDDVRAELGGDLRRGGQRGLRVVAGVQRIAVVELQDQRNAAGVLAGAGLEEAERRGVGVAAGLQRQLEMELRIVGRRVLGEAARRAVLEALVYRQDHELAGAGEIAAVHQRAQVAQHAGVVRLVPAQDLIDAFGHGSSRQVSAVQRSWPAATGETEGNFRGRDCAARRR